MTISDISWARLDLIPYVGLLVVAVIALCLYRLARVRLVMRLLVTSKQARFLLPNFSYPLQLVKSALFFVGILFLLIALLRPQWDKKEQVVAQEGRDLFIALDISRSMLAQDCTPSR